MTSRHGDSRDTAPDGGGPPLPDELPTAILALQILEAIAQHREDVGVTALAEFVGIPKARMHRHLSALRQYDFVAQNPQTAQYRLGWRTYSLSRAVSENYGPGLISRPTMEELSREVDQTVVLSQQQGGVMMVVDYVMGNHMIAARLSNGQRFPIHAVAQGKVALAFGDPRVRERVLKGPLEKHARATLTSPSRLRAAIEEIRRQGWADGPEEMFDGLNAISVPVFSADQGFTATLTIVGAVHVLTAPPPKAMLQALLRAGQKLTRALGGSAPKPD